MTSTAWGKLGTGLLVVALGCTIWAVWRHDGLPGVFSSDEAAERRSVTSTLAERLVAERKAEIRVRAQTHDPITNRYETTFEWREARPDGEGFFEPEVITCAGRQPRFEALVMTFLQESKHEALEGKSLVLFRRAYGEDTAPALGHSFADPSHPVPQTYEVSSKPSEIEQALWREFWSLATDPSRAREEGIEILQAKAVSTRLIPEKTYRITATDRGRLDLLGPFDD